MAPGVDAAGLCKTGLLRPAPASTYGAAAHAAPADAVAKQAVEVKMDCEATAHREPMQTDEQHALENGVGDFGAGSGAAARQPQQVVSGVTPGRTKVPKGGFAAVTGV